jgi:hypothetical protein
MHGVKNVVGKVRILSKIAWLVEEIEATLQQEKKTYDDGGETDDVVKGWVEALEYVLKQIEVLH